MVDLKITYEQLQQEIDEKRHTEEELQRSHVLLNAINDAQSHFITDSEEYILFNGILKNLLLLTKSEYGFIGEVLHTLTGEPYLKTKAITNIAWDDETREFYKKKAPDEMEFYNTKTLFGQVMITGKPVIANNPSKDERRGDPPDHPHLISFLGIPFYQGKKLVGMAGIANCPGGYKENLVDYLQPLLTTCANIIEAYRNENQRKKAEEELVHRARLAELGNEIGVELSHENSLKNILQRCTESIVKNLDAAFARIWTFNQRNDVLELQASAGMYTHINGGHSRIPIGRYKIGRIAKERKPHLTNSVIGDPEVHDQEWARHEKMVSFAGYPLIVEDKLVGVMAMFSHQPLTDYSLKALSSVADNIANWIERKKTEKEKERYIEAINKAIDGIAIADEIDRYIYVNSAYANIFGYSQDELMGETWRKITPPDLIASVEKGISNTMHNKNVGVFNGEVPGQRKDGTILPAEVTGTGFWDEDGSYRGHVCIVRDITEHKQTDEKMKQSEEKYRDLFQNANDAICIVDSDLKYKDVNNKTVEMLGYTREELLNMSVYDLIPSDQLPKSETEFNELRIKGSYEKFVGKARKKDGHLIDVEVSSSVIKDGEKVIGSRDIIRDITERMQNEEVLRESEERYRTIIEYSNDMIWTLDNEGHFLFFNKRSEEITGYKLEDWKGKSFAPLISEKDLPNVIEVFHKIMGGQTQQYEVSVKKKDDSNLILSVNTAPIYSKGKVMGTVSFGRDITDRKRAEYVIKESETRLQSILDNSSTVVFLKDIQGRYITVNRRYEELFHVNRNEVVNKTDYDIFPQEFADKFRMHDNQAREKLCGIEIEEVVPHDDGLHTYISVKFPLLSPDGKPYAVCGIATDITERKKAEEQIEKSLKEKEVLLREVYHRVKNNMQIITSLLNLQSRYARDGAYREMFRESHNRIKSMSLIHEKLYQSKDLSTIDFKEYIKDIAKGLFQSYGANKGKIALVMDINNISIDINTAIPCGLIINELVTNSLKHAFPGGKEGEIKIAIHSMNENTIELVVGDNGTGISEDVDFRTTESLGLQLVTMLAENQLHGEIILDRSKGTEFTITFKEVK